MRMQGAYPGVVFDLDGTLVDSTRDITEALNRAFAAVGLQKLETDQVVELIGNGAEALVAAALEEVGAEGVDRRAMTQSYLQEYRADPVRYSTLFPGVQEAVTGLRERGVTLGVCTNKGTALATKVLEDLGIGAAFSVIAGPDLVEKSKPDPSHLQFVLNKLGMTPTEVLMIGDSPIDAATAEAAGVDFRAVSWAPPVVAGMRLGHYGELNDIVFAGHP